MQGHGGGIGTKWRGDSSPGDAGRAAPYSPVIIPCNSAKPEPMTTTAGRWSTVALEGAAAESARTPPKIDSAHNPAAAQLEG